MLLCGVLASTEFIRSQADAQGTYQICKTYLQITCMFITQIYCVGSSIEMHLRNCLAPTTTANTDLKSTWQMCAHFLTPYFLRVC